MSIFGDILGKLGFGDKEQEVKTISAAPAETPSISPMQAIAEAAAQQVTAISVVDVMAKMEALSESHGEKLNWKQSIVDLMKLLGLDSSLATRKELATELGCPEDKMGDSAQMNMWLHKTVLQKLAENGGNIPQDLLS